MLLISFGLGLCVPIEAAPLPEKMQRKKQNNTLITQASEGDEKSEVVWNNEMY